MNMMRYFLLFLFSLTWPVTLVHAASDEEATACLVGMGFENVRVASSGNDTVFVAIETAGYRGTYQGAVVALQELARLYPETRIFRLMLLEEQAARLSLTATCVEGQWAVLGSYDSQDIEEALHTATARNSSERKVDLTIYPMLSINDRKVGGFWEYALAVAPALETSLWRGNRITLQPIIPFAYNSETINSDTYIRIGVASIAQDVVAKDGRWDATLAGGFFHYDRVGVDLRVGYHLTPSLTVGAETSLTGEAIVRDGNYDISVPDRFSFLAKADYYDSSTQLQGQLMAGRFIFGDYGVRADVTRHFGEYTVGLYGIATGGEWGAGFHFSVPVGPKRQVRDKVFRLRLPEYVAWEHVLASNSKYKDENMGRNVMTRPDDNRSDHYWQPLHVAQFAERELNKGQ